MTSMLWLSGCFGLALLIYLFVVLVKAEWF